MADSRETDLASDQVGSVPELGTGDRLIVDCGGGFRIVIGPFRVEQGDADSFSDNVGTRVIGMPDRAEVKHACAHAYLERFVEELNGIERGIDGSVLMVAAREEAKDAGSARLDRHAAETKGGLGDLIADAVGPIREVAWFETFGFFSRGTGSDIDNSRFNDILIDALTAE